MSTYADQTEEHKSESFASSVSQMQTSGEPTFEFVDTRAEGVAQRKLQNVADSSPQVSQLKSFQEMANNSSQTKQAAQLQATADTFSGQQYPTIQRQENNTGLPDNLKTGMENLTGHSMNDVKVHRNSDKPAQLNAHAYAQGTNIHLAPGQEKHLPHELGHVVQQKEGRVKPTKQLKGKTNINDDAALEKEADVLGAKAIQMNSSGKPVTLQKKEINSTTAQLANIIKSPGLLTSHHVYSYEHGKNLGKIPAGTVIEVDTDDNYVNGKKNYVKIISGYPISDDETTRLIPVSYYVSQSAYDPVAAEDSGWEGDTIETESDGVTVGEGGLTAEAGGAEFNLSSDGFTMNIWGQSIVIGKNSQELSGSFDKSISVEPLEGLSIDLQIPIPAPIPAFVEVVIEPTLSAALTISGGYQIENNTDEKKLTVNAKVGGNTSLGIKTNAGVGLGVANIIGASAGLFGAAEAEMSASGDFRGEVVNKKDEPWSSTNLSLDVNAHSELKGKAGTYVKASILGFSKTKEFSMVEKSFGSFTYNRESSVNKIGVSPSDLAPTLNDFKELICPTNPLSYEGDWRDATDSTPLLSSSEDSSTYE